MTLKQFKIKFPNLFFWIIFILSQSFVQNTYATYEHKAKDTVPTPEIITNLKKGIGKLFKNKENVLSTTDSIIKKTKVVFNLQKKDSVRIAKKTEKNDTIKQILKKSVTQNYWTIINKPGILVTQTSFLNWSKGGNNTIAGIASYKGDYNYKRGQFFWRNSTNIRYGLSRENGIDNTQKTDDIINLKSNFGYKSNIESEWYYSGDFSLATQFAKGYRAKDKEHANPISTFFAPARMRLGIGAAYTSEKNNLKLNLSPLTNQITFVLDQELANKGAFGVDKAILDNEGNVLKEGKNINSEFGTLISIEYNATIMKNVNFGLKSSFYTDYLNDFGNVDSDIELNINMKVNQYINSRISSHLLYDDDAVITEKDGTKLGPRLQLKQILGIGVTYEF